MTFLQSVAQAVDLSWLWSGLAAGLSGFFTWLFSRRRYKADAAGAELRNVQQAIAIWQDTAEKLTLRVGQLEASLEEKIRVEQHLRNEVINLRGEVKGLKDEIAEYKTENKNLREMLGGLKPQPQ